MSDVFWNMRILLLLLGLIGLSACSSESEQKRPPNIVFCLADDWGWPHAGAYGDAGVSTPNFDRIANEGVLFHHAYVTSPSCTPSRNAFITGKYHWELGPGANLWSTLPSEHQSFIHLLAANGYVAGRTSAKTWGPGNIDNWVEHHGNHPSGDAFEAFDEFLDTTEAKDKPFFFWLGSSDPHRGYEEGSGAASGIDISQVHLFEHYPKSDEIRNDVADYYFEVQRWDQLVGTVLSSLEKQGLLDNTIIIVSGDHGMPFPRCKGNLYDSGVRVPFAVRWGKEIAAGRKVDDFISFADIGPTLLELANVDLPNDMTGRSFANVLRSEASGMIDASHRSEIVFGRERHVPAQEKPNLTGYPSRGYRNADYLYIRNYQPDLWPAGTGEPMSTNFEPHWYYADCDNGPTKRYILDNQDKDEEHARAFDLSFGQRPAEELYDLKQDPGQLDNLASNAEHAATLNGLREKLQERLTALNDPRAQDPDYKGFDDYPYLGGRLKKVTSSPLP
ncbi:MAG: sulfatase [Bacteroidota bacterium]